MTLGFEGIDTQPFCKRSCRQTEEKMRMDVKTKPAEIQAMA